MVEYGNMEGVLVRLALYMRVFCSVVIIDLTRPARPMNSFTLYPLFLPPPLLLPRPW